MPSVLARRRRAGRRRSRAIPTPAERILWAAMRERPPDGLAFRRRHAVGPFLLGFCCLRAGLAVELGAAGEEGRHAARDAALAAVGLRVLRFGDAAVRDDPRRVVATILAVARERAGLAPPPPPGSAGADVRPGE